MSNAKALPLQAWSRRSLPGG